MGRYSACLCALCLCIVCGAQEKTDGRCSIGFDAGSMVRDGAARICFSHAFSESWTASVESEIVMAGISKGPDEMEIEHEKELSGIFRIPSETTWTIGIGIEHWMHRKYEGAFLSAGIRWGKEAGVDAKVGIGYAIRIWKGLGASICYDVGLLEAARTGGTTGKETGICLYYIF